MVVASSFKGYFKAKKVFLTGHTGFKGSWLTVWLEMLGAKVKGYALKPEKTSLFNQIKNDLSCESVIADIRNAKKLKKEIISFQPDIIFHLAAQALVRESYHIPVETFEVNAIGTANLLNVVRELKKQCSVVIITTDKVYKNKETGRAFFEEDPLGGYDPYSASKAAAEIVTESFRLSFFNPSKFKEHKKAISTVRAGNVIGGGDYSSDRLIPDIFKALSNKKLIIIRNPEAVRPWQYVLEPLSGYLQLACSMSKNPLMYSDSFNFGPETEDILKVESVVKAAIESFGKGKYKIAKNKNAPHEARILRLEINKAKELLGWNPVLDSSEAINKTMQWYKRSLQKKADIYDLCVNDINDFTAHL